MCAHDRGVPVPLLPASLSPEERAALREGLRQRLPGLRRLFDSAEQALEGPDPEAAQVFLGMLLAKLARELFPA